MHGGGGNPPAATLRPPHPHHLAAPSQWGFPTAPRRLASPERRTARAWHRSPSARIAPGLCRELPPLCLPDVHGDPTAPNAWQGWGYHGTAALHAGGMGTLRALRSCLLLAPGTERHFHKVNKTPSTQQYPGEMLPRAEGRGGLWLARHGGGMVFQAGGCRLLLVLPAQSSLICSRSN